MCHCSSGFIRGSAVGESCLPPTPTAGGWHCPAGSSRQGPCIRCHLLPLLLLLVQWSCHCWSVTCARAHCTSFLLAVSSWLWFIAFSLCSALGQRQALLVVCHSPPWSFWHLPSTGFVTHSLVFHRLRLQLGLGSFCQVLLPSSNGLGIVVTFHPLIHWQALYTLILLLLVTAAVMGRSQALTLSRSVPTQGSLCF